MLSLHVPSGCETASSSVFHRAAMHFKPFKEKVETKEVKCRVSAVLTGFMQVKKKKKKDKATRKCGYFRLLLTSNFQSTKIVAFKRNQQTVLTLQYLRVGELL